MKVLKIIVIIGMVLILIDIGFLNYIVFFTKKEEPKKQFNVVNFTKPSASESSVPTKIIDSCYPRSCVDLIREATSSLSPKTQAPSKTVAATSSSTKEFYISFGSGQTTSDEWEDISALQAYIDSTKYNKIKTVTFEASLRIPTANGRVYAQLFNATDQHPVWFSEVSLEGNTSKLVISSPIQLDSGNKLYKVQMKTTLRYLSILDQARVHIITE